MKDHAFRSRETVPSVTRIFAHAILRLHRRSALIPAESLKLSPDCLDVSLETSVTAVPAGLQKSSQRKGARR